MRLTSRPVVIAAGTLAAIAMASPAVAAIRAKPTSLNLRGARSTVAAHQHDTLTATLSSGRTRIPGATLTVLERTAPTTTTMKSSWGVAGKAATVKDDGNGTYTITVTPPIASNKNSQKDQYEVKFNGGKIRDVNYAASHSEVITVTVKRTR